MLMRNLDVPLVRLEERILLTAEPTATIAGPAGGTVDLGTDFQATITFDNTHPTDVGFGPYVDVILPSGIDGDDTPLDQSDDDGITFNSATFLGLTLVSTELVFDASGEALHPYAVDNTGNPITINGTPGDTLVVIQLPFGSFTANQTPADIVLDLSLSEDADLSQLLDITVNGGFQYGNDAQDNPATDPSIIGPSQTIQVEPVVMDFEKVYIGPEDETATGPNYTRFYELQVDIAEGQTVNNVVIEDFLPNNIIPIGHQVITGTSASESFSDGINAATNGNVFTANFGSITGVAGLDAVVRIEYYVPEFDADGSRIINATSGDDATVTNDGRAIGDFLPNDVRDLPSIAIVDDDTPTDHELEAASIVVQKSSSLIDNGATGLSPGDVVQYTLAVQISDYFTFDNIVLNDVMSDGQRLDLSFAPTFSFNERGNSDNGIFTLGSALGPGVTLAHNVDSPGTGQTFLDFDLSSAIETVDPDGILEGGLANGSFGATTATITYRAIVQDVYTDQFPSGEQQVGQGDRLSNSVDITGDVLTNQTLVATGQSESDDSAESLEIATGSVSKSIYAINGNTTFADLDIAPGDDITFRLEYNLPLSSLEDLRVVDFLPLPVFDVDLPDQANPGLTFNDILSNLAPSAGEAHFHTDDTFRALYGAPPVNFVDIDSTSNSIGFNYGDFDTDPEQSTKVDILFTVRVADADFADDLQLTNQVTVFEGNTFNEAVSDDGIIQFTYEQAELNISKGVIATDRGDATFTATAGPVSFSAPGTVGFRGSASFDSTDLDTTPINANLTGIDAGDTVSFAIVIENTGTLDRGAFDVVFRDTLPPGFGEPAGGYNLSVTDANGAAIGFNTLGTGLFDPAGGIELVDPSGTQGALASAEEGAAGANIAIITYDLVALDAVEPDETLTNVATVTNYASREGGTDHVPGDDLTDDASVTTTSPTVNKTLVSSNHAGTSGSDLTIGEEVTFHITLTLQEGTTENVVISDILPATNPGQLEILTAEVFAIGANITGSTLSVGNAGVLADNAHTDGLNDTATFNFGDLVNSGDNLNTADDQVVVEIVARVNNDGTTQAGLSSAPVELTNTGQVQYEDASGVTQTITEDAVVTIVEPDLVITKNASPSTVDGDDTVTYTITVRHDTFTPGVGDTTESTANAYDVVIQDLLSDADLDLVVGTVSLGGSAAGNATITSGNTGGDTTVGVTATQIDQGQTLTITFQATVDSDVTPGQVLPNSVSLNYDTLPSTLAGSEPHDREYNEAAGANVTVPAPGITKAVIDTSHAGTDSSQADAGLPDLTIGEVVTYEIVIDLPEGETGLSLTDNLPSGLTYVSSEVFFIGTQVSTANFSQGDTVPTSSSAGQVTYDFGNVVNTPDGASNAGDRITVRVVAVVSDVAANQDGQTKQNEAVLTYDLGSVRATADVDIVEPDLNIVKGVNTPTVDGDDTVTYTVNISHDPGSTANAYDVVLTDLLADPDLLLVPGTVNVSGTAAGAATVTSGNGVGDATVGVSITQIDLGQTLTVTFQVDIDSDVSPGDVLQNTAEIDYDTLPGVDANERDYNEDDDANVTVAPPELTKTVFGTSITETSGGEHTTGIQDLVVGELVAYELTIEVPEGHSNLVLTDNLPTANGVLSYVTHSIHSIGADLTVGAPTITITDEVHSDSFDDRIVFDFGTVINTPSNVNDSDDEIVIRVVARVEDVPANADGDLLTNNARLDYDNGGSTTASADVEIVEPELQIAKVVDDPTPDAGDVIEYTLTIDHTGASTATAFDAIITDALSDPNLQLQTGTVEVLVDAAAPAVPFSVSEPGGGGFIVNIDKLDQGQVLTITYDVLVLDTAEFGTSDDNTATVNWDSNPSDVVTDPSRSPATLPEDTATVTYPVPTFAKTVLAGSTTVAETGSSENDNGLVDLVIGEQVTFALTITVPEGSSELVLVDTLPTGLTYVSSEIATMNGQVTSTAGLAQGDGPTSQVGQVVTYNFGTVTNTGSPNDGDQQIIVHVVAVANTDAGNVNDADLQNDSTLTYATEDGSGNPTTVDIDSSATVEIVEPELQIAKVVDDPTPDAGDVIEYTLTIDHTGASTATAFDAIITDALSDPNLQLQTGTVEVLVDAAAPAVPFSVSEPGGGGFIVNIDKLDQGQVLTITYDVLVLDTAEFGTSDDNTATVNWDSNPSDVVTDPSRSPATLPEDTATVTYPVPTFAKTVLAGSTTVAETGSSENDNGLVDLVIGEQVTFALTITVPEGSSELVLVDTLPTGLTYVSSEIATMNGQVTSTAGLAQGDGPTSQVGQVVTYNFGTVTNTGSPNDGDQQIIVHVVAVANTDAGNVNDADLQNDSTLTYATEDGSGNPTTVDIDSSATVEIVEPELQIAKVVDDPTPDAGDVIEYTLTIDHTGASTATAFDAIITDALSDPNLQLQTGTVEVLVDAAAPAVPFSVSEPGGGGFIVNIDKLDQGQVLTITYDVLVLDTAEFGTSDDNTATVNWDSNPSDVVTDPSRSPATLPEDTATVTYPVPTFAKTVLAGSTTVAETGSSENDNGLVDLVIGEQVTFALTITVPEGSSELVLVDTLPTGLTYVSSEIATMNGQVTSTAGLAQGDGPTSQVGQVVTYNFGTVTNTGSPNDGDQQIIVHVVAVANTDAGNVNDADLQNDSTLTYATEDGSGNPTTVDIDSSATVEIVEPELQIAKVVDDPTPDAGDVIEYTLTIDHTGASTATAFDAIITDALSDPNLQLQTGTVEVLVDAAAPAVPFSVSEPGGGGFIVNIDKLDQGQVLTITYDVLVLDTAEFGTSDDNTATVNWDSNPSDVVTDPSRSPATLPEDTATVTYPVPTFAKTVLAGSTTVAETGSSENDNGLVDLVIGEQVTFALTITVPEGSSELVLVDTLPTGLTYVSSEIATMNGQVTSTAGLAQGDGPTSQVGQVVTYNFGTVTNTGSPNDGDQQIIVHVVAVANTDAGNVNDADLQNDSTLTYATEDGSGNPTTVDIDSSATVEIVEPELQIAKVVDDPTPDAGDVIEYTLTIDHTGASTATAFDAIITDALSDPNLQLQTGTVEVLVDAAAPAVPFSVSEPGGGGFIVNIDKLDQGQVLTITYDVLVLDTAEFGTSDDNTATVNWDSNPSDVVTDPSRSPATLPEDTATVTYPVPTFAKTVLAGSTTVAETGSSENDNGLVDLVIGEQVTFALTITVPEGSSELVLVDTLPTGLTYVSSEIATMNGQVTSTAGLAQGDGPTSQVGQVVTYNFGTVTNTGSPNDGDQQIIVHVVAVANTDAGNVNDADLQNDSTLTYATEDGSGNPTTVDIDSSATVEIVEPELQIVKTAASEAYEPGETVTYTVVVDHTGGSTATAFDLSISDLIADADLSLVDGSVTVTHSALGNLTATPGVVVTGNGGGDTDVSIELSSLNQVDTLTITYQAVIDAGADRADNFTNQASVSWDSNPGVGPTSAGSDSSTEQVFAAPSIEKTITGTSDTDTGSGQFDAGIVDASLGETITYLLEITLPEMLNENLVVTDTASDASGHLNLISGRVVSLGAGLTGSLLTAGTVINAVDNDADAYGDIITFNFGDVANAFDGSVFADDVIILEITAQVPIDAANVANVDITNSAEVFVELDGRTFTDDDTAIVEVVEPVLTIDKGITTATATSGDAADIIQYTLTIAHDPSSSAVARDVVIIDLMGGNTDHLELVAGSVNVTGSTAAPVITTPTADGFQVDISQVELNETVEVTYRARILDSAVIGMTAPNTADLSWDGTTGPTGRTETDTDNASVSIDGSLSFEKEIVATSLSQTGALAYPVDADELTIGETVTYHLTATLAEGTDTLVIDDQLPFTNGVLSVVSSRVVSIGSDITTQFLSVGSAGVVSDNQLGDSLNDHVRFNFGTVVNSGDNDVDNGDRIVVEVIALVEDLPANVRGDVLTNTGTLTSNTETINDTATVEIIEPALSIDKSVSTANANAGDVITYTLVVTHDGVSNAPAYDVVIEDLLSDPALNLQAGTISVTGVSGGFNLTGGAGQVRVEIPVLLEGETATVEFDVVIGNNAVIGTDLPNTATLDYDSASGPGGRADSDDDDEDVRVDPTIIVGSDPIELDKTIVASSLTETGTGAYPLTTDQLAIGETVTYHLTAAIAEGTDTIVIEDQLPFTNGILMVESSRVVSLGGNITPQFLGVGSAGVVSDMQLGDSINDHVRFNFGTVVNAGDNVRNADDLIVVEVVARVIDVPENQRGDVLVNTASLISNTGTLTDTADIEIVEPNVTISKTAAESGLFVGDTQTFNLVVSNDGNGPAYDVVIEDLLPAGMTLNGIPMIVSGPAATVNPPIGNGFTVDVPLLDQGETLVITYSAQIEISAPAGQTIYNNVEVESESEPGGNGRDYETSDRAGTDILVLASSFADDKSGETYGGFVDNEIFVPLVTLNPFFSGTSEYGAHITITLRDSTGIVVGTQGVLADSGGNWVAAFPLSTFDNEFDRTIVQNSLIGNSRLFDDPHSLFDSQQVTLFGGDLAARFVNIGAALLDNPYTVEIVQELPTSTVHLDNSFNARVYFTPVVTNEVFSHEQALDINRVFEDRADFALNTLYEAALAPLGLGGNRFTEEFLTTAGSPHGR